MSSFAVTSWKAKAGKQIRPLGLPGDGGAVLKLLTESTFDEYALNVFLPYIFTQLQQVSQVDIVWDQYHKNSLKSHTRSKRGNGIIMRRVASLPGNWQQLLWIMRAVFLLSEAYITMVVTKQIVTTNGTEVLCIPPQTPVVFPSTNTSSLAPCNHEEVDAQMFVHLADAVTKYFNKVLLHTVDRDVVVLAVAAAASTGIMGGIWYS